MPCAIISAGMNRLRLILGIQPQGNAYLIEHHVDPVGMNLNSCGHGAEDRAQVFGVELLPGGGEPHRLQRLMSGTSPRRRQFLGAGNIKVSFEFFPPKTPAMEEMLWASIRRLEPFEPTNIAITYGAGGSTRDRTHATLVRVLRETRLKPAAHLTCIGATKVELNAVVQNYWSMGIRHIVALRGDSPGGMYYEPTPNGYINAADLVKGIKAIAPFEISVACHPEKHPESLTVEADLDMLEAKIDAGASSAITQFFFDNNFYFRFLDRVRARGITVPIIPGIVPIHDFQRIASFAIKAGVSVPVWLCRRFEGLDSDPHTHRLAAAAFAAEQVLDLLDEGINTFHFYTLNRADLVYAICHMLGLRPETDQALVADTA
jgi:methylenetetrahydrofolate reductase (NADPH)